MENKKLLVEFEEKSSKLEIFNATNLRFTKREKTSLELPQNDKFPLA